MTARVYTILEYNNILTYLASFAISESAKSACLSLHPYDCVSAIQKNALLFEQGCLFFGQTQLRLTAFPPLELFLDSVEKSGRTPDADALWALRQVLVSAKSFIDALLENEGTSPWPLWEEKCLQTPFPQKVSSALLRCLSDDGLIRDAASPELTLVRGELRRLHRQCTQKVKNYANEYNILHFLQDDFMTLSSDRYVLPLKSSFKGRLQGVVHDYSQTGETCYFEPLFLVEINNQLQSLKREERAEEQKILLYLTDLVRSDLSGVRGAHELLISLDIQQAKEALGDCYNGRLIDITDTADVSLKEASHPLLALASSKRAEKSLSLYLRQLAVFAGKEDSFQERTHSFISAIPSTLELRPEEKVLIISGGNAGGKTVSLKTLGLIALMSQAALPVPVEVGSTLPFWKTIHAFIGDEQSLEDHVSTFTAQITHLSTIWSLLGKNDLVILDEFGAGTDPAQGAALAQAVIDAMLELDVHVVAATHFPALKAYALSTHGVRSASVLFNPKTKKPLFKLVYEQVGASLALDVAREHGLPAVILQKAEQYLLDSGSDTSTLVARLNSLAIEREEEIATLKKQQVALVEKEKKLQTHFESDKEKLFLTVQSKTQKVLKDWKEGRASHRQTLKQLNVIRTTILPKAEEEVRSDFDVSSLQIGEKVRHIPWKKTGIIQDVDARKKRVQISMNGVSLWADVTDIDILSKNNKKDTTSKPLPGVIIQRNGDTNIPLHLDLRGKRADVAREELLKFLDVALLEGRYSLEVIHGKGTGVLRKELHEVLRKVSFVESFMLAPVHMGGDGVTLVELK